MATYAIVYAGLPIIEIFAYGIRMQEDLRTHIFDEVKLWFETFIIITAYKMLFSVHYSFICLTLLITRTPFPMPFLTASPESRLATIGRETIRRSRSTVKNQRIRSEDPISQLTTIRTASSNSHTCCLDTCTRLSRHRSHQHSPSACSSV
jgi:hypothetical protein